MTAVNMVGKNPNFELIEREKSWWERGERGEGDGGGGLGGGGAGGGAGGGGRGRGRGGRRRERQDRSGTRSVFCKASSVFPVLIDK